MANQKQNYCLTTVTCPKFIVGTLVMLHSFLRNNRWFKGDIIIFHDQLPESFQNLFVCYNNIQFQQVSPYIKQRVLYLSDKLPHLNLYKKVSRFYSLEIFRLLAQDYTKLLFCDSDLLFLEDVQEIFSLKDNLYCCGDKNYYINRSVDIKTYTSSTKIENAITLNSTFNSGFMLFGTSTLPPNTYQSILELINTKVWKDIQAPFTDQIILNIHFNHKHIIIGPEYNYLISHKDNINANKKVPLKDLKVLHFNGKTKPWDHLKILEATSKDSLKLPFFNYGIKPIWICFQKSVCATPSPTMELGSRLND